MSGAAAALKLRLIIHLGDFMALVVVGQMMRRVAARGLAGSGVLLDPEQAREDLEPYSRMAGGIVAADRLATGTVLDTHGTASGVVNIRYVGVVRVHA